MRGELLSSPPPRLAHSRNISRHTRNQDTSSAVFFQKAPTITSYRRKTAPKIAQVGQPGSCGLFRKGPQFRYGFTTALDQNHCALRGFAHQFGCADMEVADRGGSHVLHGSTFSLRLQSGQADEHEAQDVGDEHERDERRRSSRGGAEFFPDGNAPDGGHKRCALAERIGDGRASNARSDDVQAQGDHPNGASENAQRVKLRAGTEVFSVGAAPGSYEDRVHYEIADHETYREKEQGGIGREIAA